MIVKSKESKESGGEYEDWYIFGHICCSPCMYSHHWQWHLSLNVVDTNPKLSGHGAVDPLPSWNEGSAKSAILSFVANVTNKSNPDYVEPEERIATFDNDGTLWCEYPDYVQVRFMLDRVKDMAPDAS